MIAFLQSIINMILKLGRFISNLVLQIFKDAWEILNDLFVYLFKSLLALFSFIITSIPVPDFISGGLQGIVNAIDPSILYFLNLSGVPIALSIIGAGYAFMLIRKIATLGIW